MIYTKFIIFNKTIKITLITLTGCRFDGSLDNFADMWFNSLNHYSQTL